MSIGVNRQVGVFAGVLGAAQLFLVFLQRPVQFFADQGGGVGNFKADQKIGAGEALPHVLDVGMFLGNVAAGDPFL